MGVHLISGDDESLVHDAVTETVGRLVGDQDRAMMVDDFSTSEYELAAAVDAAQTMPFLTERRVVVVRDLGRFSADDAEPLAVYLAHPLPTTDLVLVAGGGRLAKVVIDAVKKAGATVINTSPPTQRRERTSWLADQVKGAGLRLDAHALALLGTWLGEEPGRVTAVLDTLAATHGRGVTLTTSDVEPYLGVAGAAPPWELTDAIDRSDTRTALTLVERMTRSRHPLQVMAVLHAHYVKMLRIDGADANSEAAVAELLGIKPGFPARKVLEQHRRLGGAGVARAIALLADADLDLRGRRDLPDDVVLDVLVARLCRLAPAPSVSLRR